MSKKYKAKVLVVSDGVASGDRLDTSGVALASLLESSNFEVTESQVCKDGVDSVSVALSDLVKDFEGLVVTTGGTGFGPRDLTPEATRNVLERLAPGLAEAMRFASPNGLGRLSRGVAGSTGSALIINTPGSEKGATEQLSAVIDVVPHVLDLLVGVKPH